MPPRTHDCFVQSVLAQQQAQGLLTREQARNFSIVTVDNIDFILMQIDNELKMTTSRKSLLLEGDAKTYDILQALKAEYSKQGYSIAR